MVCEHITRPSLTADVIVVADIHINCSLSYDFEKSRIEALAKSITTFSNGCLGSHNDEERSEMRYVMRIAELRESSKF